jgi:hypothetical protein
MIRHSALVTCILATEFTGCASTIAPLAANLGYTADVRDAVLASR